MKRVLTPEDGDGRARGRPGPKHRASPGTEALWRPPSGETASQQRSAESPSSHAFEHGAQSGWLAGRVGGAWGEWCWGEDWRGGGVAGGSVGGAVEDAFPGDRTHQHRVQGGSSGQVRPLRAWLGANIGRAGSARDHNVQVRAAT